jgi:hypothetical protein
MSTDVHRDGGRNGGLDRRGQADGSEQAAGRRGLWLAFSVSESITLLSSWVALWLTVEVVPAETGFREGNPLAEMMLGWSTVGLAVFSLGALVVALGLLRVVGCLVSGRWPNIVLATGAGAVAAISLVDAGWNILILGKLGGLSAVGVPGPTAVVFGVGAIVYLGIVHWLFRRGGPVLTGRAERARHEG